MSGPVAAAGLGPAGLDRIPAPVLERLLDPSVQVVLRTLQHPAARELAARRDVVTCDDLYETAGTFDEVYRGIADRVLAAAARGPVVYAVPGSPLMGERAVGMLREAGGLEILPGESFLDPAMARLGFDPFTRGMQVLDGRDLPHPLLLHLPTFIGQVDTPLVLAGVRDALLALLDPGTEVVWLCDLGGESERVERLPLSDLAGRHAGLRVSLFLDPVPPGWPGLVQTNTRLRTECPWDREQTHHSLAAHLLEEAYETLEAIEALPAGAPGGDPDLPGYLDLEEELGDLLLQVVFHSVLASEAGVFGIEEVAEGIRRKLVRRHPHVFGDVEADTAERVKANWEVLKREEKRRESLMDGVPGSLPALARAHSLQARAARVGFDWPGLDGVLDKVREETDELAADLGDRERAAHELGDLLFSVVNLARRLDLDPEQALRAASGRFERRFRTIENGGSLAGLTLEELDRRWEAAKASETDADD
jgi:tetrapyrrole methylase family protein/MazG family protein